METGLTVYRPFAIGLVQVYNNLPQRFVDFDTVTGFQSALTREAKNQCEAGRPWHDMYRRCFNFVRFCIWRRRNFQGVDSNTIRHGLL